MSWWKRLKGWRAELSRRYADALIARAERHKRVNEAKALRAERRAKE